jgi:hypothetical protein
MEQAVKNQITPELILEAQRISCPPDKAVGAKQHLKRTVVTLMASMAMGGMAALALLSIH